MEITGIVKHAMEKHTGVSQRSGNPWVSRDYVLEIPNGAYNPRHFVFTVFGEERLKQFALRKDEEVTIKFDVDANEYQGKWYNNVQAYDVVRTGAVAQAQPVQANAPAPQPVVNAEVAEGQGDDSDLPF